MIVEWPAPNPTPGLYPDINGWVLIAAQPDDEFVQEDVDRAIRACVDLTEWIHTPIQLYLGTYGFVIDEALAPLLLGDIEECVMINLGYDSGAAPAPDGRDGVHPEPVALGGQRANQKKTRRAV